MFNPHTPSLWLSIPHLPPFLENLSLGVVSWAGLLEASELSLEFPGFQQGVGAQTAQHLQNPGPSTIPAPWVLPYQESRSGLHGTDTGELKWLLVGQVKIFSNRYKAKLLQKHLVSLFEMQILGPSSRPSESEPCVRGPGPCVLNTFPPPVFGSPPEDENKWPCSTFWCRWRTDIEQGSPEVT